MSATGSSAPEALAAAVPVLRPRAAPVIDIGLAVFVATMIGLMVALPEHVAAPFHLIFVALALAYGYRVWPVWPTVAVMVAITLPAGWLMRTHASDGFLPYAELTDLLLMPAIVLVMVWHAQRRATALRLAEEMALRQLDALEREREFFRDASHAIRTPVTIARGHLELATGSELPDGVSHDVAIALQQLDRMTALSNRLLALARLDSGEPLRYQPTDLAELIERLGSNWSASADRNWRIRNEPTGVVWLDPEWIASAVDALIENAVHFTAEGGTITVGCQALDTTATITVADSGPGIEADDLEHIFDRFWHRMPPNGQMGSGLGLSMVRATAAAHGGTLTARNHPRGGAVLELILPLQPGKAV